MLPNERQMLSALFDRIRGAGSAPRDPEAEALIADQVKGIPYAPYILAQAVLIQEQALAAASQRIQELEAKVQAQAAPARSSFLGGLFGGGSSQSTASASPMAGAQQSYAPQQMMPPAASQMMPQPMMPQVSGGGFLQGALSTVAGVAGGMLVADGIRSLFSSHAGLAGMAGPQMDAMMGGVPQETIINNYFQGGEDLQARHGENFDQANFNNADFDPSLLNDSSFDSNLLNTGSGFNYGDMSNDTFEA